MPMEMMKGEKPAFTSLVGASALPSQTAAARPQNTPSLCRERVDRPGAPLEFSLTHSPQGHQEDGSENQYADGHPEMHVGEDREPGLIVSCFDLFRTNRTVLVVGLSRRQCHDHGNASVDSGDFSLPILEHGLSKGLQLRGKTLRVALHEEIERKISVDRFSAADDGLIGIAVASCDLSFAAQDLNALVITIDSFAAVVDGADDAVAEAHDNQRGIEIAGLADLRDQP